MKKWLLGSLVGAIIIFALQFLSHVLLGLHDKEYQYLEKQDEIMTVLNANIPEDGMYMVPNLPPNSSSDEHTKFMEDSKGKPWASIIYHKSMDVNMTRSIIRGFLIDVVLVLLLIYFLTRAGTPTAGRIFAGSVAVGFFTWLAGPYMGHNWAGLPWDGILPALLDAIVGWGLCGLWLGWWLNRNRA